MLQSANIDWNDTFLTAALEPEKWPEALDKMAGQLRATHGQLIGVGGTRDIPFNIVTNFERRGLESFAEIDGGSPLANYRIAACNQDIVRGRYDGILHEKHYDATIPRLATKQYVEWCDEYDIPFGCQTNLVVDQAGIVGLAILRKRKEGRTTVAERRLFAKVAVAARRAVRLQERLEGEQARLLAGAFDAIAAAAFILDAGGRVQAMTASAEKLIADGDITLRNRLLQADALPLSLAQAVRALTTDGGLDHVRLRINCPDGRPARFMEGFRLPGRPWSLGHLPHAIMVVRQPQRDRAGISGFLSALYRLTATEAEIAMRLFDGMSRNDICEERSVTAETLRGQVKSICAKTGSQNEADLMRLLGAIMD